MVKLNTVWPFPEEFFSHLSTKVKALLMPEINMGQMVLELERLAQGRCQVVRITHPGGAIINPSTILAAIQDVFEETK